jgi:hypothetical protein
VCATGRYSRLGAGAQHEALVAACLRLPNEGEKPLRERGVECVGGAHEERAAAGRCDHGLTRGLDLALGGGGRNAKAGENALKILKVLAARCLASKSGRTAGWRDRSLTGKITRWWPKCTGTFLVQRIVTTS